MTKKRKTKQVAELAAELAEEAQRTAMDALERSSLCDHQISRAHEEARKANAWINEGGPRMNAIVAEMAKARAEAQRATEQVKRLEQRLQRLESPPDQQPTQTTQPAEATACEKKPDPRSEYGCLMDRIRELEGQLRETTAALESAQQANRNLREWQERTQQAKQEARDARDGTRAELRDVAGKLQETLTQLIDDRGSLQQALHLLRFFLYDAEQDEDHQWTDDAEPEVKAAQKLMARHRGLFDPGCDDPEDDSLIDDDPVIEDDEPEDDDETPYGAQLRKARSSHGQHVRMRGKAKIAMLKRALRAERQRSQEREQQELRTIERLIQAVADMLPATTTEPATPTDPSPGPHAQEVQPGEAVRDEMLESAWVLIANAHHGDWERAHADWRRAAEQWRDGWNLFVAERTPKAARQSWEGKEQIEP